jgi:hypothetical protein
MNKYHFFLFSFVLSSGVLPAQDWELVLASGDTVRDLSFKELQNEILLATQLGKPITDVQTFDIEKIDELRYVEEKKVRASWKTRAVGMTGGTFVGYGAGFMMGNIILWWLSYEELGSLKLFGPRPENMDSGEELITKIAIKMVTMMGLLAGYDWKMEIVDNLTGYELSELSMKERKTTVQNAIWPERPKRLKEFIKKSATAVRDKIRKK